MRENAVKRLWQEDKPALGGWLSIGNSFSAEVMAHQELDWLCLDMQHGVIDYQAALTMLQAISATSVTPIVTTEIPLVTGLEAIPRIAVRTKKRHL